MKYMPVVFLCVMLCLSACSQHHHIVKNDVQDEILMWRPGTAIRPKPIIYAERFKNNDLGIFSDDHMGKHAAFSSIMEYFCGNDPKLRSKFTQTFMKYHLDKHNMLYPGYEVPQKYNCSIWTYRAPYEYSQPEFLEWLHTYSDKTDIFEPKARKTNHYRGPVLHPWTQNSAKVNEAFLEKTFGYAVYPEDESVVLLNDNRFNPMRWIGPVNEVHHREQSAMMFIVKSRENQWQRTSQIFHDFYKARADTRILFEYDIELTFTDFRLELEERTIWDYYQGYDPIEQPCGVMSQTHRNTWLACQGKSFGGRKFTREMRIHNLNWLENRVINPNFHCAVSVNFKERDDRYRLMDFMICGKDQTPHAWNLTPAAVFNEYVVDGGGNDMQAWFRASIEMLSDERFAGKSKAGYPLITADPYIEIPEGGLKPTRVKGVIDLTRFYKICRKLGCFPGQKSSYADGWVGFEGDDPKKANPDERHGIEWVGFIFENHGPYRIQAKINQLNVRIVAE